MNKINEIAKQVYRKMILESYAIEPIKYNDEQASDLIKKGLEGDAPFLCARMGCTELQTIIFARKAQKWPQKWMLAPFWKGVLRAIHNSSGFFNPTKDGVYKFADMYEADMKYIDILASWHPSERFFDDYLKSVPRISISQIGPDLNNDSWTIALKNKRVLVVHPFAETIKKQYARREELFDNPNVLPEFKELITVKAIQSIGGIIPQGYNTWFDALEFLCEQVSAQDFDIALIACGAYGFPLASWIKQQGGKAILLGGSLQLLFGIKGKRWNKYDKINCLMNKPSWVTPDESETPYTQVSANFGYW